MPASRVLAAALATLATLATLAGPARARTEERALAHDPDVARALDVFTLWLEDTARRQALPSVSVAVVHDQELVWAKALGHADAARKVPATPATAYRIGSITKTFTAAAVLALRDAGKLRLDDDVRAHLPWLPARAEPLTIRQLLAHGGGLARDVPGDQWDTLAFPDRAALRRLAARTPAPLSPGARFKYSNLGYALAGELVEAAGGRTWDDAVRAGLLAPLGLRDTRTRAPAGMEGTSALAVGWGALDAGGARRVVAMNDLGAMAPAGAMTSTAEDLARWLSFQMRGGASAAEAQRPVVMKPDWSAAWGLGWGLVPAVDRGGDVVGTRVVHGGGVRGHAALVTFDPQRRVGFVVLVNASDARPHEIAEQLWRVVAPALVRAKATPPPPAPHLARYAGRYRWLDRAGAAPADARDMLVVVEDGHLALVDATPDPWGDRVALREVPGAPHTFRMEAGAGAFDTLTFEVDASGAAVRLVALGWSARRVRE